MNINKIILSRHLANLETFTLEGVNIDGSLALCSDNYTLNHEFAGSNDSSSAYSTTADGVINQLDDLFKLSDSVKAVRIERDGDNLSFTADGYSTPFGFLSIVDKEQVMLADQYFKFIDCNSRTEDGYKPSLTVEKLQTIANSIHFAITSKRPVLLNLPHGQQPTLHSRGGDTISNLDLDANFVQNILYLAQSKGYTNISISEDEVANTSLGLISNISIVDQFANITIAKILHKKGSVDSVQHLFYTGKLVDLSFFDFKGQTSNADKLKAGFSFLNLPHSDLLPQGGSRQ